jgi:perosamine synthetase
MIHPFRPNFDWRELLALLRLGTGRDAFESALAARVGARYGIAFAYGRSAIVAACRALGFTQAEIIVPAYTCRVVAEAVVVSGNRPVFVDINLADYNMDIGALKDALTSQTRAIVATHMHGYPADIAAIRARAGDERVIIIEDAALLGPIKAASHAGQRGDITIFSFNTGKHLYAVQGGVVVTDSDELYAKLRAYRDREMNRLPWKVWARRLARFVNGYTMLNASLLEVLDRLHHTGPLQRVRDRLGLTQIEMPGDYATAFADFQGRIGLAQLQKFDAVVARHRAWAEFYDRELRDLLAVSTVERPGISPAPIIGGATYAPYTLRVERRDEIGFCEGMHARGVKVATSFDYVLPYMEPYRPYAEGTYPRAEQAAREVVNLPNYAGLSAQGARRVVESIRHCL